MNLEKKKSSLKINKINSLGCEEYQAIFGTDFKMVKRIPLPMFSDGVLKEIEILCRMVFQKKYFVTVQGKESGSMMIRTGKEACGRWPLLPSGCCTLDSTSAQ